jgi:transcriptional regulator with XRE-family HTH domain
MYFFLQKFTNQHFFAPVLSKSRLSDYICERPVKMMTLVSQNIRYLRRLHGYTQERLAQAIGIKRSLLAAYEDGRAAPNLKNLVRFARLFDISVDELITIDLAKVKRAASVVPEGIPKEDMPTAPPLFEEDEEEEPTEAEDEAQWIEEDSDEDEFHSSSAPSAKRANKEHSSKYLFDDEPEEDNPPFEKRNKPSSKSHSERYPTLDELFKESPVSTSADIPLVRSRQLPDYLAYFDDNDFVQALPKIQISLLDRGKQYRAFESTEEMGFKNALFVGEYVRNWHRLQDQSPCLLLTQRHGLIYGRIENRLRDKGYLLMLDGEWEGMRFNLRELFEVWQVVLFVSREVPMPTTQSEELRDMCLSLQKQLQRFLKK